MVMNSPPSAGATQDVGLIPGSERSPGRGNGNPLQYSCLGNPTDRGAWQATAHRVAKSQTCLNTHTHRRDICSRSGFKMNEIIYVKHCVLWMFKSI